MDCDPAFGETRISEPAGNALKFTCSHNANVPSPGGQTMFKARRSPTENEKFLAP
jgi:hypothetical protein